MSQIYEPGWERKCLDVQMRFRPRSRCFGRVTGPRCNLKYVKLVRDCRGKKSGFNGVVTVSISFLQNFKLSHMFTSTPNPNKPLHEVAHRLDPWYTRNIKYISARYLKKVYNWFINSKDLFVLHIGNSYNC